MIVGDDRPMSEYERRFRAQHAAERAARVKGVDPVASSPEVVSGAESVPVDPPVPAATAKLADFLGDAPAKTKSEKKTTGAAK